MKNTAIWLLTVILHVSVSAQQTGSLTGRITEQNSRKPVVNASISLAGTNLGAYSDSTGKFFITGITPGPARVRITHVAYASVQNTVEVQTDRVLNLEIELKALVQNLSEFIVKDKYMESQILSRQTYVASVFDKSAMEEQGSRDIADFLRSSKNINAIRKGGTQLDPVVRGFKYSQLNVQINQGQKVEGGCPNRMDPATAHIEVEDIESIEIHKGPYALRYGPSFGAVVDLQTRQPLPVQQPYLNIGVMLAWESNWNGNKEQVMVETGNKWGYLLLSGGRKDFGNYDDGNGNTINSSFKKYFYRGSVGFRPGKDHLLSFTLDQSYGRDVSFPTLTMDERKDDTRLMSFDYHMIKPGNRISQVDLKVYNSNVRHEMDNKERPNSDTVAAISIIEAVNSGGRAEASVRAGRGLIRAGIDYEEVEKDGDRMKNMILQPGLPIKTEPLWNQAASRNTGLFAEYTLKTGKFDLVGALRLDLNSAESGEIVIQHPMQGEIYRYGSDSTHTDFTNISLSAGATWHLNKRLSLSLAAGRGERSPDLTERFIILLPIGYDNYDYLGNPKLEPEVNNQMDLTLKYSHDRLGLFQANGFYSLVNDYITGKLLPPSVQKPLTAGVLGVKQFYNAGKARLRGFEFSYGSPERFQAGATLSASLTYGTLDEVIQQVVNESGEVTGEKLLSDDALSEIPPFEATVAFHYRFFSGRLVPKLNIRLVSAQNHISLASYEQPSNAFCVTGLSVHFKLNDSFSLNGGVSNLFDVAYYEHLNRNIVGSPMSLYEPGRSFYINMNFKILQ